MLKYLSDAKVFFFNYLVLVLVSLCVYMHPLDI